MMTFVIWLSLWETRTPSYLGPSEEPLYNASVLAAQRMDEGSISLPASVPHWSSVVLWVLTSIHFQVCMCIRMAEQVCRQGGQRSQKEKAIAAQGTWSYNIVRFLWLIAHCCLHGRNGKVGPEMEVVHWIQRRNALSTACLLIQIHQILPSSVQSSPMRFFQRNLVIVNFSQPLEHSHLISIYFLLDYVIYYNGLTLWMMTWRQRLNSPHS